MNKEDQTVHIKIDKNVQIHDTNVHVRDIAQVECGDKAMEAKVKSLRLDSVQVEKPGRYVCSVMGIFADIHRSFPEVTVENVGEDDFIITYEKPLQPPVWISYLKTAAVALIAFFGAAFAIMTFNNDVDIPKLFSQLYLQFTGRESDGFTILELTYSVGLGLGILIFFNHFAGKKLTKDPTPMEVEMRLYEDEVDTTLIEASRRKPDKEKRGGSK